MSQGNKPFYRKPGSVLTAAISTAVAGFTLPSISQAEELVLEEIVVTAQRREQNLQEVPVSVTAFSGQTIDNLNITEASQFLALSPNVSFTEDGQTGSRGISISMRGVSNINTDESSFIQSIGIYLDEFSVASTANATINPQMLDLERVEVLRGPQGTYFGRNAVGGALNLATNKPNDEFSGKISAGTREYDTRGSQWDVSGILNVPISDTFMARAAVMYEDNSGIIKNIVPGGGDSGHEYFMGRLALRWLPSDATTIDFMYMYTDEEQGVDETVPSGVWDLDTIATFQLPSPGLATPLDEGHGFYPNNQELLSHSAIGEENINESSIAVLNIRHELTDTVTLKWITGIIETENEKVFDNDLIAANTVNRFQKKEATSWSTELRVEITNDTYDWVIGGMWAEDEIEKKPLNKSGVVNGGWGVVTGPDRNASNGAPILGLPPEFLSGIITPDMMAPLCLGCFIRTNELESWAVFTDFTWHVNDKLDLTVGFRYTEDDVDAEYIELGLGRTPRIPDPADPTGMTAIPTVADNTFEDFSPRFSVGYQVTEDMRIYGVISQGYKAGGFTQDFESNTGTEVNEKFDQESITNYELGIKSEWWDNRLRINASIYLLEWEDLQLETFFFAVPGDATSNTQRTINVRDAEATGFEIELAAALTERLTVTAGLGITDTEIQSNDTAQLSGNLIVNLKGEELPRAPELTWSIMADYVWPWKEHELYVRGEWIYRDSQFSTIEDVTYKQTSGAAILDNGGNQIAQVPVRSSFPFESPDYDLVNVRAGVRLANNVEVNLYVINLFDEEYYTGTGENFGLSGFRLRPHPRYYGGSISYSF